MPHVRTVPVDAAEGLVREQYERELATDGRVSNMTQLFSLRPEVISAETAALLDLVELPSPAASPAGAG
jgi:hypothetical protein